MSLVPSSQLAPYCDLVIKALVKRLAQYLFPVGIQANCKSIVNITDFADYFFILRIS